jgi:hypothetical protein
VRESKKKSGGERNNKEEVGGKVEENMPIHKMLGKSVCFARNLYLGKTKDKDESSSFSSFS